MATKASDILNRVRTQLIDTGPEPRWTDAELLRYLSDGQRTIAAAIPSNCSEVVTIPLVAGTRQRIPADGQMLLSVTRNKGLDGLTPGRAVRLISREIIDAQNPDWHTDTPSAVTTNYLYDPQEAVSFFVYPPSTGTNKIEINYAIMPQDIADMGEELKVIEIYRTALYDYVMYRAHQKDSDFAAGQALSQSYLEAFKLFLGLRSQGEESDNPNQQLAPTNLQVKGAAK